MGKGPFPAIHRTANEKAASNVRDGRELRDRSDTLLGDIDDLLDARPVTSPVSRTAA